MKVIKRNGSEAEFDTNKIAGAIRKASDAGETEEKLTKEEIERIAEEITEKCTEFSGTVTVEEVQDLVEDALIAADHTALAKRYIKYRYTRQLARHANTTDDAVLALIDGCNEEARQENSNKDVTVASVQRDYMAGYLSRDLTERVLLPADIVEAHKEGIIHFHDTDYYAQRMYNCCLVNLEDMLQNGTVISGTKIDPPKSFATACTVASQIISQVASNQHGGQTFTLAHLAPFVDVSRQKIKKRLKSEFDLEGLFINEKQLSAIAEKEVIKEIEAGMQTIQYQLVTLMTTNGQAPFVTAFMYINEVPEGQTRDDLVLMIKVMLEQRILGVKNEQGIYITPAFPKLIYVLDENNMYEGTPYYYLTVLAAKCTAKRMVPDYISAKVMKELKGEVYSCMGCVDGKEVVSYKYKGTLFVESFERMWNRLSRQFAKKTQPGRDNDYYIDLADTEIYDNKAGWTECRRIIKNDNSPLIRMKFSNGRTLTCTPDHPFETENRGIVSAESLTPQDVIAVDKESSFVPEDNNTGDPETAWLYGFILCDSSYVRRIVVSIAASGEEDIKERFTSGVRKRWGLACKTKLQERERKGTYQDVSAIPDGSETVIRACDELTEIFGGLKKYDRHIPNEVFSWGKEARTAFLAGMMDADGYIDPDMRMPVAFLGSTNKELVMQQAILVQTLGMKASIYQNHYKGKGRFDAIRYTLNFYPTQELVNAMACQKKKEKFKPTERKNVSISETDIAQLISSEEIGYGNSYDVTTASEHFTVSGIYSHNCRSFLTPDRFTDSGIGNIENRGNYRPREHRYYGRFNQGVVTLNLVDVACSSGGDEEKFWEIMEERLELCHRALRCRHERLKGTLSDTAPILWQHGAIARLKSGEKIDPLLYNGYSTISLGYAGLYECVKYMTGKSHTDPEVKGFALSVMQALNDACAKWKAAENIDYSVYGTPLESTTYKFAKCLQKRFGIISEVTDHGYITNSYHVSVREKIDAFTKLKFESEFQKLSPGGAISYVEVPNMQNNIEAVLSIMGFIYDNIMYAELNTKSDYCQVCGFDGEIEIVNDDGKLVWQCPNCGNRDQAKMNVARRTCGYIGTQYWNQGRTEEIRDRFVHVALQK